MGEIDIDALAKAVSEKIDRRACNIRTKNITQQEHEEHHAWWRKWIKPLTLDLEAVGRRVLLFGFFGIIMLGIAIMLGLAYLLKTKFSMSL